MRFEKSRIVLTSLTSKVRSHTNRKSLEIYHDREVIKDFYRETRHCHKVQGDRLTINRVEVQNSHHVKFKKALK